MLFKVPKIIIITVAVFAIYVSSFGIYQFGMGMDTNGEMVNCPFSSHSMSICKMNPIEHIGEWKSMFMTLPPRDALPLLSALLSLLALMGLRFLWKSFQYDQPQAETYTSLFYLKHTLILNPIQESFSRGILNPKIF